MSRTINYDFHWDDEREFKDPEFEGETPDVCDLCYRSLKAPGAEYVLVQLRAVCKACLARFQREDPKVNRTLGLLPRGCYARGKGPTPPSNNLGRGDT